LEQNGCAVPNIGKLGRTELTKTINPKMTVHTER
jgi:hypothetical protein